MWWFNVGQHRWRATFAALMTWVKIATDLFYFEYQGITEMARPVVQSPIASDTTASEMYGRQPYTTRCAPGGPIAHRKSGESGEAERAVRGVHRETEECVCGGQCVVTVARVRRVPLRSMPNAARNVNTQNEHGERETSRSGDMRGDRRYGVSVERVNTERTQ
jgi:hypothetical protein